jgi:hypothetical protein
MNYEMLRNRYKKHIVAVARLNKLEDKAKAGALSPDRLAACNNEIARLSAKNKCDEELFTSLEKIRDPAWLKLGRELDAALKEYSDDSHDPISMGQMFKKFFGTMSILILGTWMIDSWRKK